MVKEIVKKITVNCDPARAFDVFVKETSTWWPLDKHAVSAMDGGTAKSVTIEPKLDGEIFEITPDNSKVSWGRVTAYSEGHSIAMTWHPGGDPTKPTNVSVSFEGTGDGKTEVTLVHSNWGNLGDQATQSRAGYDGGWVFVFETCYANAL